MGFFFFLLLLILLPLLYVRYLVWRARRRFRSMFGGDAQSRRGDRARDPQPEQPKPRKVFDRSVGEYVDFEEISVTEKTTSADGSTRRRTTVVEQQVTDAEWEDIK